MPTQIIVNQAGPLPIKVDFTSLAVGITTYLEVNGSVFSNEPNHTVGIGIDLDGHTIGSARILATKENMHLPVVPAYIPLNLSLGQHTLYLYRYNGATVSDEGDLFTAVIQY